MIAEPALLRARTELLVLSSIQSPLEVQIRTAAIINRLLAHVGGSAIIVGGSAVSFYTGGAYLSRDVDLVTSVPGSEISTVLEAIGFQWQGSAWIHATVDVVVDFPAPPLAGDLSRVARIETPEGPIGIIGLEDLLIDRINAVVHWRDSEAREWCLAILTLHSELDMDYLMGRARSEGVDEELRAILAEVQATGS